MLFKVSDKKLRSYIYYLDRYEDKESFAFVVLGPYFIENNPSLIKTFLIIISLSKIRLLYNRLKKKVYPLYCFLSSHLYEFDHAKKFRFLGATICGCPRLVFCALYGRIPHDNPKEKTIFSFP